MNENNENGGSDKPEQSFHEKKIEALEKLRRPPSLMPVHAPGGGPRVKQHTHEDRMFNAALDRQIAFWQKQVEKTQDLEEHAKDAMNTAAQLGIRKIKGKARDDFALGKEKDLAKRGFNRSSGFER